MGKTKKLNDGSIPVLAAVDDGALVTVVDAATGAVSSVSFAMLKQLLVEAVAASGRVLRKVILPDADTDADTLTDDMTVYSFRSDRPSGKTLTNFPPFGAGGISLTVIHEGAYIRQIFQVYGSGDIYARTQVYRNGVVWGNWHRISSTKIGGGNLFILNNLQSTERRGAQ